MYCVWQVVKTPTIISNNPVLTYLLTPWSRVLLEKLTSCQLVKNFPAFYGTRRFIAAFTSASHLSLSWSISIQSMPPYPTFWRSILISSSHLRLGFPSGLFPLRFPHQNPVYTSLVPIVLHTPPISFFSMLQARVNITLNERLREIF